MTADGTDLFGQASALASEGKSKDAAFLYRQLLEIQPQHLAAAQALADLVARGDVAGDPAAACKAAIDIETGSIYSVAKTALNHERFDVALRCYRKILDLDPEYEDAIWGLAEANYGNGDRKEALVWYRRYHDLFPDDPEAAHMVAALGDGPKPVRASDAYVKETFDNFAEDFDRQLLEDLEYKAPKLIYALFRDVSTGKDKNLAILDAGCGTGLAGVEFKSHASSLIGVDLSPEMLKLAEKRKIYDELLQEELAACMQARAGAFDLIVAADVFCYIGDLADTLEAAGVALRSSGRLIFSVEAQSKRGFSLTGSGRYAHKPAYIRKAAEKAGLREVSGRNENLRMEYGEPVKGYLTVLEKP